MVKFCGLDKQIFTKMMRGPAQPPTPHVLKHDHVIVYPLYIDSKITEKEGRKISKEDAIENPTPAAMLKAVKELGFEAELQEYSRHPHDFFRFGRLQVKFFDGEDQNKKPLNPEIKNRRLLYRAIAKKMKEQGQATQAAAATGSTKKSREERLREKRSKGKK